MNKKIMKITLCCMLLAGGLFISTARAENSIGPNVVTGNQYVCYFVCSLDVFNSQVSFSDTGGLTISSFSGYGFYVTVTSLFTGAYISLDATIGTQTGDIIMLLVGSTFEPTPFIAGTGVILFEYSQIIPVVFTGFASAQTTT
ncbi:MAG: hypothetical protein NTV89_15955 [Proteobacteria bacterium]|nr:hypothetical protein [Pseudomonadota bacterium]